MNHTTAPAMVTFTLAGRVSETSNELVCEALTVTDSLVTGHNAERETGKGVGVAFISSAATPSPDGQVEVYAASGETKLEERNGGRGRCKTLPSWAMHMLRHAHHLLVMQGALASGTSVPL